MRRFILAATAAAFFALAGCGSSNNEQPASATNSNGTSESATNAGSNAKGATATKGGKTATGAPVGSTVIPAGTVVTVRLGESLGSKTSSAGQNFSATLAEALMVD